jgi:cyclic pyranopterin phosphate synthase
VQVQASRDLVDGFARVVRDLRVSVTDRCNFRCVYCMPEEGMQWLPRQEILTFEEIERVVRLFVERLGVESVRLTGGEPTVRAHLPELVMRLAAIERPDGSRPDLSLTTNGATLRLLAGELRRSGLQRVNISCDSLRRERFAEMTRRDRLEAVLDGIAAACEEGFDPVKVNVVVMRGVNDDELVDFAAFGRQSGVQPRFIEFMPLDADGAWSLDKVVPASEIVDAIDAVFPLEPVEHGPEPAARWRYKDGQGEIGVISSVSHPFCSSCDRVRITAEGQFRTCLFATSESDLRGLLRRGADDDELIEMIAASVGAKWAGHRIGRVDFVRPKRSMSQIGG